MVKGPPASAGDTGLIPGPRKSHRPCETTTESELYSPQATTTAPTCPTACALQWEKSLWLLQPNAPGKKITQKGSIDRGVQFITPAGLRQTFLFSQGPRPTFVKTLYTLSVLLKPPSLNSLNLAWKVLKGDTIRLQPWFIIRRVSWLYIVDYTNGCHKDYKGDRLHRGLSHSFWQWVILVWNLVFISPGGQFAIGMLSPCLPGTKSKVHWKCKMGVSFFFKMESARPVPFLLHEEKPTHFSQRAAPTLHNERKLWAATKTQCIQNLKNKKNFK